MDGIIDKEGGFAWDRSPLLLIQYCGMPFLLERLAVRIAFQFLSGTFHFSLPLSMFLNERRHCDHIGGPRTQLTQLTQLTQTPN